MLRSGADFRVCFGADIRLPGKSRVVTERISAATNAADYCGADIPRTFFFHGAVDLTPSSKPHQTAAFPHGAPQQLSVKMTRLSVNMVRISASKYREVRKDALYWRMKLRFSFAKPCGAQRPAPTEKRAHVNVESLEKTNKPKNIEY